MVNSSARFCFTLDREALASKLWGEGKPTLRVGRCYPAAPALVLKRVISRQYNPGTYKEGVDATPKISPDISSTDIPAYAVFSSC